MFNLLDSLILNAPKDLVFLFEIGIIILIATFASFLVRIFKQPLIPAYIITGILIGPVVFGLIGDQSLIDALSQIGVAFLIFTAGLEIKISKLKEVGKVSLIGGIFQVLVLFWIAYFISTLFGIGGKAPVYIGLIVAFSSTMIVVKLLSDKRELNSLHGRIIIGILLVQDIIAIIALTILNESSLNYVLIALGEALIFAILAFLLSRGINPVLKNAAKNQELLLLVSISFLFLFIIGSFFARLSIIIGAFFAGVSLANSDYKTEIEGKVSVLRDFFAVIFFVALGMQLRVISKSFILLLIILLVLVMVIKPLITMFLVRFFGYKKGTAFLTGNALAQTSEFSFILVTLGLSLGHLDRGLFSTLVLLTILTMSLTTYLIGYEKKLSKWLDWPLNILNRFKSKEEELEYKKNGTKIILIGCHRMGSLLLKEFEEEKKDIFVIDYNPEIIKHLMNKRIPCIYGDYANEEVLQKSDIKKAEMLVSTIPDVEDNLMIIKKTKKINPKIIIFIVADRISEAIKLYQAGADYVILPQVIGGEIATQIIRKVKKDKTELKKIKKDHLEYLDSIHHILY
jgi:Kef-type K+ transport system membrane component KefB